MKKGQLLQEHSIGIILTVVIIIIMVIFFSGIAKQTDKSIDESKCYKEVVAHVQAVKFSNGVYAPPINCPIITETLKEKEKKEIEFALAERMRKCWHDWQEGKQELFKGEGIFCHPCYIVDFEKKDIDIKDFDKFLINTRIKGQKYTYMQYLTGNTNDENFASEKLLDNPSIKKQPAKFGTDTSKIILFYYIKDEDTIKEFVTKSKNTIVGAAAGGATVGIAVIATCGFFTLISGGVFTLPCVALAIGGATTGAIGGGIIGYGTAERYPQWLAYTEIRDYKEEELENLKCEIAPASQKNTK